MESITTTMENYHNILNELDHPCQPDIGEPDVILADGEQWKSDVD